VQAGHFHFAAFNFGYFALARNCIVPDLHMPLFSVSREVRAAANEAPSTPGWLGYSGGRSRLVT